MEKLFSDTGYFKKPVEINRGLDIQDIRDSLSSELILGMDFLSKNGAVINVRTNKVAFMTHEAASLGNCRKALVDTQQ